MQIAIVVYPGLTALDIVGPYELLRTMRDTEVRFVWHQPGPITTDSGTLILAATHSFAETPAPDIVLVGGSLASTMSTTRDEALLRWLRQVHETSTWTVSVCSGSVILAAAGLLRGIPATSHWMTLPILRAFGARPDGNARVVRDGKIITAAGVSAGIDLGLELVGEIEGRARAEAIQLLAEYDPQPPYDSGHVSKASARTKSTALQISIEQLGARVLATEASAATKLLWDKAIDTARRR